MPGQFTISHTYVDGEVLTGANLTSSLTDIINHMEPVYIDDASSNLTNARATTDMGEVGTETLATTTTGELLRLRFSLYDVKKAIDPSIAYWYETPFGTVVYSVKAYGAVGDGLTNDTTAIASAITALPAGGILYFPPGAYLTTASIATLHTVLKAGTGNITRGSDTFYLAPTSTQSNIIYVAATGGNNANDGLTSIEPVATLAQALTILKSYGPTLNGTWTIKCAVGTYSQGNIDFPVELFNLNRVVIQGVVVNHPNVPTTIFDGGSSLAYGLNFNSRAYVTISNIKFRNYTSYGVVGQDLADVTTVNVHVAGVSSGPGIKMQQGRLRVGGGIIGTCQTGVTCISNTTYTIGDGATSTADGTQFTACTQAGIFAQEDSTGHADYCTINNCAIGIDLVVRSRAHAQGCVITNNSTAGIRCRDNSSWFDNGTVVNFSGNQNNELIYSYSGEVGRDGSRTSEIRQPIDMTLITTTGVFGNAAVKTYNNAITLNSFNVQTKAYRVVIYGTLTGTAGTKNITVNLAGSAAWGVTIAAAWVGDYVLEGIIYAYSTDGLQQSFWSRLVVDGQAARVQQGSRSINMMTGSNIAMTINNTVNGAADTIVIRGVEQYCIGGV